MKKTNKHNSAFTIVELLIVIVVIAILAAITVVAYNGVQRRAYNTAVISQARQAVDLVNAYIAVEEKYPLQLTRCATIDNECTYGTGVALEASNTALITALRTIGTPASNRVSGDANGRYGIRYDYWTSRKMGGINGRIQPVAIMYYLKGVNQNCSLPNVMNSDSNDLSTTGNSGSDTSSTVCQIHIEGPAS